MEPQEQTPIVEVPKKTLSISVPASIITAGVVIALALFLTRSPSEPTVRSTQGQNPAPTAAPTKKVTLRPEDYVRGDITKASVVIVEYSDSDCPFCQRFHVTMKEVLNTYGTKVAWVYRYFPLTIHPDAQNEAVALECVGQLNGNDTFWKYLDQLIEITVSPESSKPILSSTAAALGVDTKAFETCLASTTVAKKVADQSTEGQALGAQGTPYSVAINKKNEQIAIRGALPTEQVKAIIDSLLK